MDRTTQADIRKWLERGKSKSGCTHVIVACDTFDYEDYPVFVMEGEDVHEVYEKYNGSNMQTVMEVYNLSMDIEKQLNERRSFNF
jgi:ABC-type sulfate/molybdate transport systems ATPase subunit